MNRPPDYERRSYYRLRYPRAERPALRSEDREFKVSEVSEGGARIVLKGEHDVELDQPFAGTLCFPDGESTAVEGIVMRSDEYEIVVALSRGVSLNRMVKEQSRLRQKYPIFFHRFDLDDEADSTLPA